MMRMTLIALSLLVAAPVAAQTVGLTEDEVTADFTVGGQTVTISRIPDPNHRLSGEFTRTSRVCPPACIQPMVAARGVETVAELELIKFLQRRVSQGTGLLVDARLPAAFGAAAIPGSVNVPSATLEPQNPYRRDILLALGAVESSSGQLDFSNAMSLLVYGDGPWSETGTQMIEYLVASGYPPAKLFHYRGGMQSWVTLGLSTARPQNQG